MDVRNCKGCGRLFNYISGVPLCQACKEKLEDKFQQVKEYLRENPDSTMQAVSEDNDVSVKQIRQWVREERLTFSPDSPIGIECENCGRMIKTGRFCDECRNKLKADLESVTKKGVALNPTRIERSSKDRMRFLDK